MAKTYASFDNAVKAAIKVQGLAGRLDAHNARSRWRMQFMIIATPDGRFEPFFWTGHDPDAMQRCINLSMAGWSALHGLLSIGHNEAMNAYMGRPLDDR